MAPGKTCDTSQQMPQGETRTQVSRGRQVNHLTPVNRWRQVKHVTLTDVFRNLFAPRYENEAFLSHPTCSLQVNTDKRECIR